LRAEGQCSPAFLYNDEYPTGIIERDFMLRRLTVLLALFFLATIAGAQQKANPALPSEDTVNAFLRATFGFDPSLSWKIVNIKPSEAEGLAEVDVVVTGPQGPQEQKFYVTPDSKHAVIGDILPFGSHPYAELQKTLEEGLTGPSRGPANAPVTVVEFSDLQCPHCKEAQPTVNQLMTNKQNVRLVFQSFPLPMHDWAAKAAAYADCVARASNDAFWKFIDSIYYSQADITASNADEKLTALADAAGVKGSEIATCAAKPETATRVEKSVDLGKKLDVNSTPTFFVNGRRLPAVSYDVMEKIVDFTAKQGQ
jgi:protein-disulfide isomerase